MTRQWILAVGLAILITGRVEAATVVVRCALKDGDEAFFKFEEGQNLAYQFNMPANRWVSLRCREDQSCLFTDDIFSFALPSSDPVYPMRYYLDRRTGALRASGNPFKTSTAKIADCQKSSEPVHPTRKF